MKTVNEVIAEIEFCNRTVADLENYADGKMGLGCAETMRDAVSIIERYVEELGKKQIK